MQTVDEPMRMRRGPHQGVILSLREGSVPRSNSPTPEPDPSVALVLSEVEWIRRTMPPKICSAR